MQLYHMLLIVHTIMFEELCTLSIEQALYVYVNFEFWIN